MGSEFAGGGGGGGAKSTLAQPQHLNTQDTYLVNVLSLCPLFRPITSHLYDHYFELRHTTLYGKSVWRNLYVEHFTVRDNMTGLDLVLSKICISLPLLCNSLISLVS